MAKIKIDPERRVGKINRNIYGAFIEHLGRCIYGGIYEENSPLSDDNGFRRDVIKAVRALRVPVIRWPGGNFASGYHWLDGIGPKKMRPQRLNLAWDTIESNCFGTDEFIEYCRTIGAEPYICVNLGNGTAEEAASWVDYCNGIRSTYYADLRRKNGHTKPYGVKYWGLGNEIHGEWQIGHKSAVDYAKEALEFAKVMRRADPKIRLIAVGDRRDPNLTSTHSNLWNLEVVRRLAQYIDYLSLHFYVGNDDYYDTVASSLVAEKHIELMESAIEIAKWEAGIDRPIKIAFDEWNVWYGDSENHEKQYNLRDALVVATFLNAFQRHCQVVTMANIAQMVNVIAPIFTNPKGLFLQTIYFPLKLYAEHCGEIALDTLVECDTFSTVDAKVTRGRGPYRLKNVPYLDVAASFNDEVSKLSLAVVNRHRSESIETIVEIAGTPQREAEVYEINGRNIDAKNSFDEPENVKIQTRKILGVKSQFTYTFPAHSVTLLKISF